jgi:1-acyl-sn-glycerol-3-phosphate acyltransferase
MIYLRSFLFAMGQVLITLIMAPLIILSYPLPFHPRYRFAALWGKFVLWWLKLTCGIRYEVSGRKNIPADTAGIIMCKHQSAWETISLQSVFPPQIWVLKRELLWLPFFGWALAALDPIAIDRKAGRKAFQQVVEQGRQRLDTGRWVVIFPEGTRIAPGQKGRYRQGGAVLAEQTGYPIVPVAHNAGVYWPRHAFLKHPGTIHMKIGKVIDPQGKTAQQIIQEVEDRIETMMASIGQ